MMEWRDTPDREFCVRVDFASGETAYSTLEGAVRRLDFIDEDLGRKTLLDGTTLRSGTGAFYTLVLVESELRALWGDR